MKTTLGLLFSWLHIRPELNRVVVNVVENLVLDGAIPTRILHSTVVITLGNLASFPSYSCLVLEGGSIDNPLTFDVGLKQLSFYTCLFT